MRTADTGGKRAVIHCWGGNGRTGHVLAAWLVAARGRSPMEAIDVKDRWAHRVDLALPGDLSQGPSCGWTGSGSLSSLTECYATALQHGHLGAAENSMATFVVGDIHGNAVALERLLQSTRSEVSGDDTIVFLGDYIDRGPDSRACIEAILTLRECTPAQVMCLRGNHEDWLLRTMADHSRHSWLLGMEAFDTISSYSPEAATALRSALADAGLRLYMSRYELPYHLFFDVVPALHLAFFSQLALVHQSPDCVCAHAGIDPAISDLAAQPASAVVWGNPSFPSGYSGVVPVVYGHWHKAAPGPNGWPIPHVEGNTICVDTSEYGVVTAIRMPERRVIQSNELETVVSHLTV